MSQSPKRASESADDSAAKKTKTSDARPAMSDAEVAELNAIRKQMLEKLTGVEVAEFNAISRQATERLSHLELLYAKCDAINDDDLDGDGMREMLKTINGMLKDILSANVATCKILDVVLRSFYA